VARAEAYLRAKFHMDPFKSFGRNTPTLQTDRQRDNGPIA